MVRSVTVLVAGAARSAPALRNEWPAGVASEPPDERPVLVNFGGEPGVPPQMMTAVFLTGHPDVRWRREALHSYSRHEYDIALDQCLRAARYGDKPAQAMLAEMYWKGTRSEERREGKECVSTCRSRGSP